MIRLDGWITVNGYDVYVEGGIVKRAMPPDGMEIKTLYPYRAQRSGGWWKENGLSVSALRSGMKRGTIRFF